MSTILALYIPTARKPRLIREKYDIRIKTLKKRLPVLVGIFSRGSCFPI